MEGVELCLSFRPEMGLKPGQGQTPYCLAVLHLEKKYSRKPTIKEVIYFGTWFKSVVTGLHCFGACGEASLHGENTCQKRPLSDGNREAERGFQNSLQRNTSKKLTSSIS